MNTLILPAMDGSRPLGFLSALGLLRLLDRFTNDTPRLSWSRKDLSAQLLTKRSSIDDVVDDLWRIVNSIPDGGVLRDVPNYLPPPGEAPDKLRIPPLELSEYAKQPGIAYNPEAEAWLASLVTDLVLDKSKKRRSKEVEVKTASPVTDVDKDNKDRAAISLMAAPSGKQSMRTMLEKPLNRVREEKNENKKDCLFEALDGWRRYAGVTGEYLDNCAIFNAADSGTGKSEERGVPGATWLALMSYPLLRTTAIGKEPITTSWYRRADKTLLFIYPLWEKPLDPYAILALLEHPLMTQCIDGNVADALSVMGVFSVQRAKRYPVPGRKFAGVLGSVVNE